MGSQTSCAKLTVACSRVAYAGSREMALSTQPGPGPAGRQPSRANHTPRLLTRCTCQRPTSAAGPPLQPRCAPGAAAPVGVHAAAARRSITVPTQPF